MREIDRWGSELVRERGRLLKRERERERGGSERGRERRGEYENREGKEGTLCAIFITNILTIPRLMMELSDRSSTSRLGKLCRMWLFRLEM